MHLIFVYFMKAGQGGRGRQISEASLVYKESSRTARAAQRNPVSNQQQPQKLLASELELRNGKAT